jgi:hypothetical protein
MGTCFWCFTEFPTPRTRCGLDGSSGERLLARVFAKIPFVQREFVSASMSVERELYGRPTIRMTLTTDKGWFPISASIWLRGPSGYRYLTGVEQQGAGDAHSQGLDRVVPVHPRWYATECPAPFGVPFAWRLGAEVRLPSRSPDQSSHLRTLPPILCRGQ